MPKLSEAETEELLNERGHLARIATVRADGSPSVVPVWFLYDAGRILITPRKFSEFYADIQNDPRVAITIDEDDSLYRKVLVVGSAEILYEPGQDGEWRDIYRRIALRYVDEASADFYLTETRDQRRALIGVTLAKAKVVTWRMPREGEPYTGIWASRYYDKGTKFAREAAEGAEATGAKLKIG